MGVKREHTSAEEASGESSGSVELAGEYLERHTPLFGAAAKAILAKDPQLLPVFEKADFDLFKVREPGYEEPSDDAKLQNAFSKLGGAIVGQQISNAAARSIRGRVQALFGDRFPEFGELRKYAEDSANVKLLRECGLSQRKVTYLLSLADYFDENGERLKQLYYHGGEDTDTEICDDLVNGVKGIGPWTAKMFLVSGLRRFDVFAPEDVGVARGFARFIGDRPEMLAEVQQEIKDMGPDRKRKKSPVKHKKTSWKVYDIDLMEKCAERFAPYRTVFMFLLWRLSGTGKVDVTIDVENQFVNTL